MGHPDADQVANDMANNGSSASTDKNHSIDPNGNPIAQASTEPDSYATQAVASGGNLPGTVNGGAGVAASGTGD